MVKRWTDVAAELQDRMRAVSQNRPRPEAEAPAETSGPDRVVETSEAWGMPDVRVRPGSLQEFTFKENAEPRSHVLTVELNTRMTWSIVAALARHLAEESSEPFILKMSGRMEDTTGGHESEQPDARWNRLRTEVADLERAWEDEGTDSEGFVFLLNRVIQMAKAEPDAGGEA
jgi:hypothetical protein